MLVSGAGSCPEGAKDYLRAHDATLFGGGLHYSMTTSWVTRASPSSELTEQFLRMPRSAFVWDHDLRPNH